VIRRAYPHHPFGLRHWRSDPAPWRIAPIAGLGLPLSILLRLMDAEIDTAGAAWRMICHLGPDEAREMARALGISARQAARVERAIVKLRDDAGDPAPRKWS
jgi:hypothetical protein